MKVLNGKRSTLMFQLDNGEVIKIKPGEFSTPFIGNAALVRTIIGSGKPDQIGFVVSNSYELNMIQDIPLASRYYHATEEEAKEVILSGKSFEQNDAIYTDPVAEAEVKRLKEKLAAAEELAKVNKEVADDIKKKLAEAEAKIEQLEAAPQQIQGPSTADLDAVVADRDLYKSKYESISDLYEKSKAENVALTNKSMDALENKKAEIDELSTIIEQLKKDLNEANAKLAAPSEPAVNKDGKTLEEVTELYDRLYAEASEALNSKDAEIAKLKEDGAKLYENYTKAKDAATTMMNQFGISYVDGKYVQTVQ